MGDLEPPTREAVPSPKPRRKASKWKKTFLYASWRSLCDLSFSPLASYIEGEFRTIKRILLRAPGILILIVLGTLYLGYFLREYKDSSSITLFQNATNFLSGVLSATSNDFLNFKQESLALHQEDNSKITNLKLDLNAKDAEIGKVISERNSAQQRLAILEATPSTTLAIYTNMLSLTNFVHADTHTGLSDLLNISLVVNGVLITNSLVGLEATKYQVLILGTNRTLIPGVLNVGELAIPNLTVDFLPAAAIQPSALIADGWAFQPPRMPDSGFGLQENKWNWSADRLVGPHSIYYLNALRIQPSFRDDSPFIVAFVAYAPNTRARIFVFFVKVN